MLAQRNPGDLRSGPGQDRETCARRSLGRILKPGKPMARPGAGSGDPRPVQCGHPPPALCHHLADMSHLVFCSCWHSCPLRRAEEILDRSEVRSQSCGRRPLPLDTPCQIGHAIRARQSQISRQLPELHIAPSPRQVRGHGTRPVAGPATDKGLRRALIVSQHRPIDRLSVEGCQAPGRDHRIAPRGRRAAEPRLHIPQELRAAQDQTLPRRVERRGHRLLQARRHIAPVGIRRVASPLFPSRRRQQCVVGHPVQAATTRRIARIRR